MLSPKDNISIKDYTLYNYICTSNARTSGGTSIIANCVLQKELKLNTRLQAIAVQVTLHRPVTICSLYPPPNITVTNDELLFDNYHHLSFSFGDFNAHNPMWGSISTKNKGNITEQLIDNFKLCLLNNPSPTYLHPATCTFSCIDLSIVHSAIYLDFDWKVLDDQYGSDHYPLLLTSNDSIPDERRQIFKFKKVDWETFTRLSSIDLTKMNSISFLLI
jgi:hypothetical protein